MAKKHTGIKRNTEDFVIGFIVGIIMLLVFLLTFYPFYYSVILSFNEGLDALRGGIFLWPRKFTLENYAAVFGIEYIPAAFLVTVLRTVIGTLASVVCTGFFAFAVSHNRLMFRKFYITVMIITMYFGGGLIPYYMVIRALRLMNSFWVYIIPHLLGAFNAVLMMNYFRELPPSLEEAARIDGASDLRIFLRIIVPISLPVIATIALYAGVFHWNTWTDSAFFITNKNLKTLGNVMINLINQTESAASTVFGQINQRDATYTSMTIRPAAMVVCVAPIVMVYPFLQKYFIKGIMLGSVKE